jgi:hypothetical protein
MYSLVSHFNRPDSPINILLDVEPSFITKERIRTDTFFAGILQQLDFFLETQVLPMQLHMKLTLLQLDFKMPLNFVMLP